MTKLGQGIEVRAHYLTLISLIHKKCFTLASWYPIGIGPIIPPGGRDQGGGYPPGKPPGPETELPVYYGTYQLKSNL